MAYVALAQIDHIELFVPDRYEVATWYQQILGFEIPSDFVAEAMLKSVHGMTAGLPSPTLVTHVSAAAGHRVRAAFDTAVSAVYRTMVLSRRVSQILLLVSTSRLVTCWSGRTSIRLH